MANKRKKEPQTEDMLVQRFEQMLAEGTNLFFDLHEFEHVIQHYSIRSQWQKAFKACEAAFSQYPFASELGIEKVRVLLGLGKYRRHWSRQKKQQFFTPTQTSCLYCRQALSWDSI
jgi:hypothetical protein